ncbi:MAG: 4-hydroxy-tetrahydrodipicolinate synthase [Ignavibacteriae bacterium]|nr:4-hydroxy-tetrahydrodipicolinate synthase [Ignavibacteria bacterium]MBI3364138.1 4-hydroxy-tetrahydrodipicolinate synthase [Ignavibacteriota bacterium]
MKKKILFRGTGTALITPFTKSGDVDERALRRLVDFQITAGVEALLPTGTTGESVTLSDDEQIRVVEIVVNQTNGRVPVFAGAGSNSTNKAVSLALRVLDAGADGILSVAPYYNKPTQEGYFQHYAAIAEAIDAPIIVYNVPGRTASNIEAETTLRIAEEIPPVVGIKEASGNFGQIMEILRNRPKGFGVWSGDDAITLPLVSLGADGVVSVVSNEAPKLFSNMIRLALAGKFDQAAKLHYKLLPLMNINFVESNPIPVKAALAMMKMIEERYRLPMVPLSAKHRPMLKKILEELGLLD